ncbi:MAG: hypothetical protein JWM85_17 [Acidimicrobiaceae bacterium]|nr:hypothetical protein [Acidimicrobiaceae bacterium]
MPDRVEAARLRRLADELEESGVRLSGDGQADAILLEEIDHALRPTVHERRVTSSGTIIDPKTDPTTWAAGTQLDITPVSLDHQPLAAARRFADGQSTWLLRRTDTTTEWLLFDRPAGSERDLVVLAKRLGATIVQRHPGGTVRVVGRFGVARWDRFLWHLEPPVASWIGDASPLDGQGDEDVLQALLEFAVHDLGANGIGSLLVYRPVDEPGPPVEQRLPTPPPLEIRRARHLAPLRHALAQIDGAAVFDAEGVIRSLGVRLVPSAAAEENVDALGGTRHTSGRRYSYDDPSAIVIAVSEDGPISVLRAGKVLRRQL